MSRVKDKVVIVTGGALGIGKAACLLLAKEGAKIAVTDILEEEGKKCVEQIKSNGGMAEFWKMDTSSETEVKQVFKQVIDKFDRIDVLVNNAGIEGVNKQTHEVTEEEWDKVTNINVKGVFFCTKHAIPYMKKIGGGSIINLSSIYGLIGAADVPPYHASKGAVRLMTKTDALIYAKDKIRVNSVHPGYIVTPMLERFAASVASGRDSMMKAIADSTPIGHAGEANDIAYGIVYLASDESKFMTGSELVIDGGFTAR
jgi:NAD(P)-dependent dehydrogenase (short-subunit alcohol dehydrogenase family)